MERLKQEPLRLFLDSNFARQAKDDCGIVHRIAEHAFPRSLRMDMVAVLDRESGKMEAFVRRAALALRSVSANGSVQLKEMHIAIDPHRKHVHEDPEHGYTLLPPGLMINDTDFGKQLDQILRSLDSLYVDKGIKFKIAAGCMCILGRAEERDALVKFFVRWAQIYQRSFAFLQMDDDVRRIWQHRHTTRKHVPVTWPASEAEHEELTHNTTATLYEYASMIQTCDSNGHVTRKIHSHLTL